MGVSAEQIGSILKQCLAEGKTVEIDGLGVFRPSGDFGFTFERQTAVRVFLAYVEEDGAAAERLFQSLRERGFDPWLDRKKLMPGQNWPRSIEDAIETSDFFVALFSSQSVTKRGGFQAEIRYALDCARRMPLDEIFLVPARLDPCPLPGRIRREWQYVDLFPHWERGVNRITAVLHRHSAKRRM